MDVTLSEPEVEMPARRVFDVQAEEHVGQENTSRSAGIDRAMSTAFADVQQ